MEQCRLCESIATCLRIASAARIGSHIKELALRALVPGHIIAQSLAFGSPDLLIGVERCGLAIDVLFFVILRESVDDVINSGVAINPINV